MISLTLPCFCFQSLFNEFTFAPFLDFFPAAISLLTFQNAFRSCFYVNLLRLRPLLTILFCCMPASFQVLGLLFCTVSISLAASLCASLLSNCRPLWQQFQQLFLARPPWHLKFRLQTTYFLASPRQFFNVFITVVV